MIQSTDQLAALRTTVTRIVRETTGLHELLAVPVAAAICTEIQHAYGGAETYFPAPSKAARNQAILDDWRRGLPPDAICLRHAIARRTFYRLISQRTAAA